MEVLITTHFVKDFDLGVNGNLYGGRLLEWLDEAGALFVHSLFDGCFVTWKIGETIFHRPVKAKSVVKIYVKNVDLRAASVGFDLVVRTRDSKVLTTSMVFVSVDPGSGQKRRITSIPREGTDAEILRLCSRDVQEKHSGKAFLLLQDFDED